MIPKRRLAAGSSSGSRTVSPVERRVSVASIMPRIVGRTITGMSSIPSPPAVADALELRHSWVGGREAEGGAGTLEAVNPATGTGFARASLLDAGQAADAIGAAVEAFPAWSRLSFHQRGRHLLALRRVILDASEELADLVCREQGKPPGEALNVEIYPALEHLKHLAEKAGELLRDDVVETETLLFSEREARIVYAPMGAILVITPWNYPFAISVSGVATALAAGNTVVLKPAPATTLVGLKLGELCRRAGLPDGVVSVVSVTDDVASQLVEDRRLAKVVFTGSVGTGRRIMAAAAANVTPVVLELGGKDAAVVARDADVDHAAQGIVWGAFVNAGQTCASVERVYVEEALAERFVARVVELTGRLRVGDASGGGEVEMGPLTMERQRRTVEEHVRDALELGAVALTGGETPEGPGWFYPPTVLAGVTHEMRIMREETFGPVLPIMSVPSLDEAIRLANDSEYGLTASGWTRSRETAERLQRELHAGTVTINDCVSSYGEPTAPWGGAKRFSGMGRAHGLPGLREMVHVKYVSRDPGRRPAAWWYPYDAEQAALTKTTQRALHSAALTTRVANQLRMLGFGRFWRRAPLSGILRRFDQLF